MSHSLKIASKVTYPDGTLFYEDMHHWGALPDDALAMFKQMLDHASDHAKKSHAAKKGDDDENLSATLTCTVDGVTDPSMTISATGVSYATVTEVEERAMKMFSDLLGHSKTKAAQKAAKKAAAKKHP